MNCKGHPITQEIHRVLGAQPQEPETKDQTYFLFYHNHILIERARSEVVSLSAVRFIFQRSRMREKKGDEMTVKLRTVVEALFSPLGPDCLPWFR